MTHAVFAMVFLLLAGVAALGAAFNVGRRERRHMAQRVARVAENAREASRQNGASVGAQLAQFDGSVRGIFSFGMPRTWAMTANALILTASAGIAGMVAWFVARYGIGFSPFLAGLTMAGGFIMVPRFILARQQWQAETAFTEAFPETLDSVTRMLQAGMPIAAALRSVGNEAPSPINGVFGKIADQTNIGVSISDALDASSRRIGLPDFRFFAVAIVLQSTTGGNMVSTLERLSEIIRKRRAVRKKAKAVTAEVRFAAYILGALPFLTVGALLVIQPDYLDVLFADPRGHVVMGIAAGLLALAALSIRTLMGSVNNV